MIASISARSLIAIVFIRLNGCFVGCKGNDFIDKAQPAVEEAEEDGHGYLQELLLAEVSLQQQGELAQVGFDYHTNAKSIHKQARNEKQVAGASFSFRHDTIFWGFTTEGTEDAERGGEEEGGNFQINMCFFI